MHRTILFLAWLMAAMVTALPNPLPPDEDSDENREEQKLSQEKYFNEAGGNLELVHYDGRYFKSRMSYEEHRPALRHLIRSWLTISHELGIETWLAHGTLLGWWWGGHVMPWDYDLDVQMPTATLSYLGRYFNQTVHDYTFDAGKDGAQSVNKTYLLDVNPHAREIDRGNGANVIDARWIDTSNGVYIDITGLAERDPSGAPGVWSCKNSHKYRTMELYPIRRTEFEGVPARVPFAYEKILTDEYGEECLFKTEYFGHHWVPELREWVKNPDPPPEQEDQATLNMPKPDNNDVVLVIEKTVVKGAS